MIIRKEINFDEPLTNEQVKMLRDLESRPIQYDEDCPELTAEQIDAMMDEAQKWAASVGYKESDVNDIIKDVRKKKRG